MDFLSIAEFHFGRHFVQVTAGEYYSPDGCPWCGGVPGESDRFRLMLDENPRVWCRQCNKVVFLSSIENSEIDKEELLKLRIESIERRQKEQEKRIERIENALELMKKSRDSELYHEQLWQNQGAMDYWRGQGFSTNTIKDKELGYCPKCPTAPYSDSYTIPVKYNHELYNIRHRLIKPNGTGKYRPHMAGLPAMIYNADDLNRKDNESIFLLEGEKKSIMLSQEMGFVPNIATMGMTGFKRSWVSKLDRFGKVYVIFDPDATDKAADVASWFNGRGLVVSLPTKADDFFNLGGKVEDFVRYVELARPV